MHLSNNLLVDTYNRNKILECEGQIVEYKGIDTGEKRRLSTITAQSTLWLKKDCPVILLQNISSKLVNGLRGYVRGFETAGPVVEFPSVSITSVIKQTEFSVFSSQQKRNLATRKEFPLKLAYALTIHKAQGMTLDSVEIDCKDILKAGQLGVAIGRVRSTTGLRVINFHPRYCIRQPVSIEIFLQEQSKQPHQDISCCSHDRYMPDAEGTFYIDEDFEPYDLDPSEERFDEEFEEVLKTCDAEDCDDTVYMIPEGFNITTSLQSMNTRNPITPKQNEVNFILDNLDHTSRNDIKQYCAKEFTAFNGVMAEMNITEPVAVKAETLTKFYERAHQYQTSPQHRLNCMLCFKRVGILTDAHWYILYQLTVAMRKFTLSQKEKLFPTGERDISRREVTSASRSRIRYVGGYCVHKIRQEQLTIVHQHMYSKSVQGQCQYQKAVGILNMLSNFREEEQHIKSNTVDPDSLLDIVRKQYSNKGLTHITDEFSSLLIYVKVV